MRSSNQEKRGLPVIAQTIVYKKRGEEFEFLLLKRSEGRGGFWNFVNGTLELNESLIEYRRRELMEEAHIERVRKWSEELHRFSFPFKDYVIVVVVFAAEVPESQTVKINEEHTEYRWVSFEEALTLLKFDDDKRGLQICHEGLMSGEL